MMIIKNLILKTVLVFILFATTLVAPKSASAWGPKGHTIVVQIAMQLLKPDVRQNVLGILQSMPLDTAANWMDIMRSNPDYDFMKPWHYIDFAKEQTYQPSTDENIVNRLIITFNELRHKKTLCSEQIKTDLLILLHLMGDLHQPLHTGYDSDLGGNKVAIQYDTLKTNLHHFWDEEIIDRTNITLEDCMKLYNSYPEGKADSIQGIHPASWMKETRTLLDGVYAYPDFTITKDYLTKNRPVVVRQLLLGGIRLAAILDKLFYTEASGADLAGLLVKYKNAIEARDVNKFIGKKVTVCTRVYGIKTLDNVTFINVGDRFPNSPLTLVIFKKDRDNFKGSIEELFNDKNICVEGTVVDYKGKAEIILTKPEDVMFK